MNQTDMPGKEVVKVSVTKESPNERVGLILMTDDDGSSVVIKSISPNSLFAGTQLQPGMVVQSVNSVAVGERMGGMGLADTMRLLREVEDAVTIEAIQVQDNSMVCLSTPAPLPGPEPMMLPVCNDDYSNLPELMAVPLSTPVEPVMEYPFNPSFRPVVSPTIRDDPPPDCPVYPLVTEGPTPRVEYPFPSTESNHINNNMSEPPHAYPLATEMSILRPVDSFSDSFQNQAVSVTVVKSSEESLVGINLVHKRLVGVLVSSFTPESICQNTQLQVGMKILAINDVDCSNVEMCSHVVAALLRSCVGSITIQAEFPEDDSPMRMIPPPQATRSYSNYDGANQRLQVVTATVYKPTRDSKVGLGICDRTYFNNGTRTIPVIDSIASNGLAANTGLRKNMRVLCLNGVSCGSRDAAIAMTRMAQGSLTILAGPTDMVAATVTKSNNDNHTMGLDLEQDMDGKVRIRHLPNDGLFAKTDLRKGMQVLMVNSVEVDQLLPTDVKAIMDQVEGTVTIIARA